MHLLLSVVLGALLTSGCVSVSDYPADWAPQRVSGAWCGEPLGVFANAPLATTDQDEETSLILSEVFFGSALTGFDVTTVGFSRANQRAIVVTPRVGEHPLREQKTIEIDRDNCTTPGWRVKSDLAMLPEAALSGLLWTGGIVMPMVAGITYELTRTEDGDLAVHATVRTTGTVFLFFPMRARIADEWFLFPKDNAPIGEANGD